MSNAIGESILIIYNPRGFDFVPQCSRGKEATDSLAISFEVKIILKEKRIDLLKILQKNVKWMLLFSHWCHDQLNL